MRATMLLTFSSQIESADNERRVIAGKIVPFEEVGNTSVGKVVFAKDSIEIGDPGKIKMLTLGLIDLDQAKEMEDLTPNGNENDNATYIQ